jgi:hypothetical protein
MRKKKPTAEAEIAEPEPIRIQLRLHKGSSVELYDRLVRIPGRRRNEFLITLAERALATGSMVAMAPLVLPSDVGSSGFPAGSPEARPVAVGPSGVVLNAVDALVFGTPEQMLGQGHS